MIAALYIRILVEVLTQNNRYIWFILKLWLLDGELKIMKNGENQKFLAFF